MKADPNAIIDDLRSRIAKLEVTQNGMAAVLNSLVNKIEALESRPPKRAK